MSAESEELYSLLIPLSEDRLIVPRACVAEVVRFSQAEQQEGAHDWMLGTVNWNGRQLPVVSFEGALDKVGHAMLAAHVKTCVTNAIESGKPGERKEKLAELMDVFSRFGRVRP